MARSDLLIALAKAGTTGDKRAVRSTLEAMIAEERAKNHGTLADRLTHIVQMNGAAAAPPGFAAHTDSANRGRDFVMEVQPRRQLAELILPDIVRRGVDELVEEQLRADVLRAHGVEPRHRLLVVGPPGTGKTTLAEGVAEAIAAPLFVVRYESMIGSYLGETAARLKRVFDYARTTPCVLFFDEFDAIGKERGDVHETGEIKRVVTSLLMQIDDLPSYTVVIAATNHAELLDRAAWRRFQIRLALPLPTQRGLSAYIEAFVQRLSEPLGISASSAAKELAGISYAEAEQFCLDLRRRQILAMGTKTLKAIATEQIALWKQRAQEPSSIDSVGRTDAGTTASHTSDT